MKQIYHFEGKAPPVLRESILREELERRRLRRQTALLALGGMLSLFCLFLAAVSLYRIQPVLALGGMLYLCAAITGGCVLILVFMWKRRELTWR